MLLQWLEVVDVLPTSAPTLVELLRRRAEHQPDRRAITFVHDLENEDHLTFRELDARARAVAAQLQAVHAEGERVLLLFPAGLEYVSAFLGCLYAGAVAVPVYPPHRNRTALRLELVARDSGACFALASDTIRARVEPRLQESDALSRVRWISIASDPAHAAAWTDPQLGSNALAFLQYTSGSTGAPKGVVLTHRHLLHNEQMIQLAFDHTESRCVVGWLPLYHDMGLIGNLLQCLYSGARLVLMAPETFLTKPLRWLQLISNHRGSVSGGPNSAYELCIAKTTPEQRAALDLSCWDLAYTGSEPIRPATIERFSEAFAPAGFRKEAFTSCYGFAEATLFVAAGACRAAPRVRELSAEALAHGSAVDAAPHEPSRQLVSLGKPWLDQRIVIADPETKRPCPPDTIGEIWLSGGSVAGGVWNRESLTQEMFEAHLEGTGEGPFLRSGDLGFLCAEGELFFTGRLRDRIVLDGRHHYPQDLEEVVESVHPAIRNGCVAAFSVDDPGGARLVIVAEVDRHFARRSKTPSLEQEQARLAEIHALCTAIHQALEAREGVRAGDVLLISHNRLPRTTSGKLQRFACKNAYLARALFSIAADANTGDLPETSDLSR